MSKCKMILRTLMIALVVVLFAGPAAGQYKGYPKMCTENATVANPGPSEYVTCDQQRAGTGTGVPNYVRLQDGNGANLADVETFNAIVAGIALTQRAVMSAAMALGYDPATLGMEYVWATRPNDAVDTGARGLVTVGLNMLYTTAGWRRDRAEQANSDAVANTTWAPYRLNLSLYQDTGFWRRWSGGRLNQLNLANTERGPNVRAFPFAYNLPDGDYDVLHSAFFPANFGVTSNGLKVMSGGYVWDITNAMYIRDQADAPDGDAIPTTQPGAFRIALGHMYSTDGDVFTRRQGETADGGTIAVTRTATYGFNLDYSWDGAQWSPIDMVTTQADGLAFTLNGKVVTAVMYGSNGATLDMLLLTANGGLQVGIEEWHAAFDGANSRINTFKADTAVFDPAKTSGTAVDETATNTICASTYILNTPNFTVTVKNAGGGAADTFTDVDVQMSDDEAGWISLTSTACDTLVSGASGLCYDGSSKGYPYLRVNALVAAGDTTTADCKISGNKN